MNTFTLQRPLTGLLAAASVVLAIYAELIGRTLVHTGVPSVRNSLRPQLTPTRAGVLYAPEATAALNHLRFADAGDARSRSDRPQGCRSTAEVK